MECVKFAIAEENKVDKFVCTTLPYTGISDEKITEKLLENDIHFFTEEYLLFLTNPEEAGAQFILSKTQGSFKSQLDLELIKRVNTQMAQLEEPIKQVMISKLDNYMVRCLDSRGFPKRASLPPSLDSWLLKSIGNLRQLPWKMNWLLS